MPTPDPTTLRDQLTHERDDLAQRLAELTNEGDGGPEFDENFADAAQVTAEQVENRTLAASLRDQLDDVEAALARLEAGTYGACEICGKPVSEARLEAMPATRFCIDHA